MNKQVTISLERYKELLEQEAKLDAMIIYGVDNWQGYGECFNEEYNERLAVIENLTDAEE